jgi:hypothetical protein
VILSPADELQSAIVEPVLSEVEALHTGTFGNATDQRE